jgi:hypothetical protein
VKSQRSSDQGLAGAAYSVVSRELKLKIVGVADLDPESMRGPTRARVFLPLKLAESLHVMQPTDLREVSRAPGDQPVYSSVSVRVKGPGQVQTVEDAIKKMGFNTFSILDASRSIQQFFKVLDVFLGNLRQPCPGGCFYRNRKYAGYGHPRASPRNWHYEGDRRQRW